MRIVDLSKTLYTGMKTYPNDPEVEIKVVHTYEKNTWELRTIKMGSHTGTHVDAFSHMYMGARTIDKIPLDRFMGKSQVVEKNGVWPEHMGLFYLEEIGIESLKKKLWTKPKFVGGNITDALERALLKNEIITYTGLVNLGKIPLGVIFMFYGFPLKIQDGDGSPVRALAIIEE